MKLGTLRALYRYPVKSLPPQVLDAVRVDADGVAGDRGRALIAGAGARAGKTARGKEHPRFHLMPSPESAIASAPEERLSLEEREERYFDDAPVSLIIDRWLDGLSAHVGYPVEHQRFRPNFFIEAEGEAPSEDALTGRELQLGEVVLRVRYPIERCVVTTYDLHGGEPDPRILKYVAQERSAWMGIYCDVPRAGIVRIGDSLSLIER
jgi:uncharacterized protein